jgi:hypothetical protein
VIGRPSRRRALMELDRMCQVFLSATQDQLDPLVDSQGMFASEWEEQKWPRVGNAGTRAGREAM